MSVTESEENTTDSPESTTVSTSANDGEGAGTTGFAIVMQVAFVLASIGLIIHGLTLMPEGAVQQIYQLNAITSGLVLMAIVGAWAAIDAVKRAVDKR